MKINELDWLDVPRDIYRHTMGIRTLCPLRQTNQDVGINVPSRHDFDPSRDDRMTVRVYDGRCCRLMSQWLGRVICVRLLFTVCSYETLKQEIFDTPSTSLKSCKSKYYFTIETSRRIIYSYPTVINLGNSQSIPSQKSTVEPMRKIRLFRCESLKLSKHVLM